MLKSTFINEDLLMNLGFFKMKKAPIYLKRVTNHSGKEKDILTDEQKSKLVSFSGFNPKNKTIKIGVKLIEYMPELIEHKGKTLNVQTLMVIENGFASFSLNKRYIGSSLDVALNNAKSVHDYTSLRALQYLEKN